MSKELVPRNRQQQEVHPQPRSTHDGQERRPSWAEGIAPQTGAVSKYKLNGQGMRIPPGLLKEHETRLATPRED